MLQKRSKLKLDFSLPSSELIYMKKSFKILFIHSTFLFTISKICSKRKKSISSISSLDFVSPSSEMMTMTHRARVNVRRELWRCEICLEGWKLDCISSADMPQLSMRASQVCILGPTLYMLRRKKKFTRNWQNFWVCFTKRQRLSSREFCSFSRRVEGN